MSCQYLRLFCSIFCLIIPAAAQNTPSQPQSLQEPVSTLQTFSRMVTLELVAKDSKGKHITGLTSEDFRIFEQTPSRGREKREQKIAAFREVRVADLATGAVPDLQMPQGMYSNLITRQKDPVPPTILLVDGLNTEPRYQAQIHVQMLRMLRSLPTNVPVAVFLLGGGVQKVQDFTTDPRLLQAALSHVINAAGVGIATVDPRDDPHSMGNEMATFGTLIDPATVTLLKEFDQRIYAGDMDMRVNRTINALTSVARHVAGYPGRKNLLWLSTAFPIALKPIGNGYAGYRNYWARLQELNGILSDAKVAVYPINVAGVRAPDVFKAETTPADLSATGMADSLDRESVMRSNEQDTMLTIADGTGGRICTGDNDLGNCVQKAVDDSSDFYEIAYYPDAQAWNGDYRKITVNTEIQGVRLAYRDGYFATPTGSPDPKFQATKLQASCEDYLDATFVAFTVTSLPPDSPEQLKFGLSINTADLTLPPVSEGGRQLNVAVGVCTFNKKGWALNLLSYPIYRTLNANQYESLMSAGHISESIFVPGPKPAAVRLLVRDVATGRLGSVYIKVDETTQPKAATAASLAPRN